MASQSMIDYALDVLSNRLQQVSSLVLLILKRYPWSAGLLVLVPFSLFLMLASSSVFHQWHLPWSPQLTQWLFRVMTVGAGIDALIYGATSLQFFLLLWRRKLQVKERKRPGMALSFLLTPLYLGLIAAWGVTFLKGHMESQFAVAALIVFTLLSLGRAILVSAPSIFQQAKL